MTTIQKRKALHKRIDRLDDRVLNMLHAMLNAYSNGDGEDSAKPGKPMSLRTLRKNIRAAEAEIDAGKFITQEDLEKEMRKW